MAACVTPGDFTSGVMTRSQAVASVETSRRPRRVMWAVEPLMEMAAPACWVDSGDGVSPRGMCGQFTRLGGAAWSARAGCEEGGEEVEEVGGVDSGVGVEVGGRRGEEEGGEEIEEVARVDDVVVVEIGGARGLELVRADIDDRRFAPAGIGRRGVVAEAGGGGEVERERGRNEGVVAAVDKGRGGAGAEIVIDGAGDGVGAEGIDEIRWSTE